MQETVPVSSRVGRWGRGAGGLQTLRLWVRCRAWLRAGAREVCGRGGAAPLRPVSPCSHQQRITRAGSGRTDNTIHYPYWVILTLRNYGTRYQYRVPGTMTTPPDYFRIVVTVRILNILVGILVVRVRCSVGILAVRVRFVFVTSLTGTRYQYRVPLPVLY